MPKIIISGPESTGKTVLGRFLADRFEGRLVDEYAREYVEKLGRPYTRDDVMLIARMQHTQFTAPYKPSEWIFFDTGLIITKVWLEVVFGEAPGWIDSALRAEIPDLVLLCYPDLEWKPDPVRENGGEMRKELFKRYRNNLEEYNYPYYIVKGRSGKRFDNALSVIENIRN